MPPPWSYSGTELQDAINGDGGGAGEVREDPGARCVEDGPDLTVDEAARRQHTPKVAFVAPPKDYVASSGKAVAAADVDLLVRAMSIGQVAPRDEWGLRGLRLVPPRRFLARW